MGDTHETHEAEDGISIFGSIEKTIQSVQDLSPAVIDQQIIECAQRMRILRAMRKIVEAPAEKPVKVRKEKAAK